MSQTKVLLIDDDEKLGRLLSDYLKQHEIELTFETHPDEGKKRLSALQPDLVILDVMMPGQDGFSLCQEIRAKGNQVPIIMLTARREVSDRVLGLEIGADDYLPKPFEPRELAARIKSIKRRARYEPESGVLSFGELEIDKGKREVVLGGSPLDFTSTEYEVLLLLAGEPGKKFTRDEIMNHLNGVDSDVYSRSIDILVSRVRGKLKDDTKSPKFIKTVRGTGYVFVGREA